VPEPGPTWSARPPAAGDLLALWSAVSFSVRSVTVDAESVVRVAGEVDIDTAPRLRTALDDALRSGAPVVLDLTEVTFMDSSGFGVLAAAQRQAGVLGTTLRVRGVPARIRDLMALLGLDTVLTLDPSDPSDPSADVA
jgi:anti-sigma B factor antagonist